jgi:hypothetical protein
MIEHSELRETHRRNAVLIVTIHESIRAYARTFERHTIASVFLRKCLSDRMRDTGFEPAAKSPFLEKSANRLSQIPSLKDLRGLELCEVIAAWPDLPEALRAGVLAIIRTHSRDLSINRGSEAANGAKVAAARAAKRQSSDAGAKPEQPVCGQVGTGTGDSSRGDSLSPL